MVGVLQERTIPQHQPHDDIQRIRHKRHASPRYRCATNWQVDAESHLSTLRRHPKCRPGGKRWGQLEGQLMSFAMGRGRALLTNTSTLSGSAVVKCGVVTSLVRQRERKETECLRKRKGAVNALSSLLLLHYDSFDN